jgi:tRNA 5-methylaminomethyl-2-thiouridine biosynthesis bifunctional protein
VNYLLPLQPAQLSWDGDTPEAAHFGDIYFSRENGLEESRHVFLKGNRLGERWKNLPENSSFVIGETGFGTGLNFLLAWQLWLEIAPKDAQLFFISTELFPLTHSDIARALAFWPELGVYTEKLLRQYPSLTPGFHWLRFVDDRVTLLLLLGDANDTLPQLNDSHHANFIGNNPWSVDAWFLDGFSPAKNPQLWQQNLLQHIGALSKPGTTLATFTAAGQVRRDLTAIGFTVKKISGYGRKREMSVAECHTPPTHIYQKPDTPWLLKNHSHTAPQAVTVIGAGLAGCHIARALAERGVKVTLIDQHGNSAQEASGNPQGALYTKLSANAAALSRYSMASFQYALRHYAKTTLDSASHRCGQLQLQLDATKDQHDFFQHYPELMIWLEKTEASAKAGIRLEQGAWWLSQAGWADPQQVCALLLKHPNISTRYQCRAEKLLRENGQWHITDQHHQPIASTPHIVIACANRSAHFDQTAWLPLRPVRGQITFLDTTTTSASLQCVVCDEGYLTPAHNGQHCLGASFIPGDTDTGLRNSEHRHNLHLLTEISTELHHEWSDKTELHGRAALRSTTPDHLPMVGALPNVEAFQRDYAALGRNAKKAIATAGTYEEGLWICSGFGGRGLCYIPLAAELLASQILNQPRPLSRDLQKALAPARFIVRSLSKNLHDG